MKQNSISKFYFFSYIHKVMNLHKHPQFSENIEKYSNILFELLTRFFTIFAPFYHSSCKKFSAVYL